MRLVICGGRYAISRFGPAAPLPDWLPAHGFVSSTRTPEELSLVCLEEAVPGGVHHVSGFRRLAVVGPLELEMTGVLASLATPLAAAGVPIFTLSTFDTDHLLVRESDLERAVEALAAAGHQVERGGA